jgi:iron(III) transport system substrate-binding protein
MTDTDDVWAAKRAGADIEMVYPRHIPDIDVNGGGTLLIPNTVARVRGGPNPAAAATLIDFLLSARAERMLAESDSRNVPMNEGIAEQFPELAVPDPMNIDWAGAAAMRQTAIDQFNRAMESRRSADAR